MQTMLLAVDPSLTSTGWAMFQQQRLIQCGAIKTDSADVLGLRIRAPAQMLTGNLGHTDHLVIEVPQIYKRENSKGDPNKITPLWGIAGAIVGASRTDNVQLIKPREWKGQVPKIAMFARILKRLDHDELAIFNACMYGPRRDADNVTPPGDRTQAGDALDAIGIGLWALGRLRKG